MRTKKRIIEVMALIIAIALALSGLGYAYQRYWKTVYPNEYEELVLACAEQHGLSPSLVMGVIHAESGFDSEARSNAGALGLMQITEDTFSWAQARMKDDQLTELTADMLLDPEISIQFGTFILKLLKNEFSDEDTVLAAYNAGIGRVRGWLKDARYSDDGVHLKDIPFKETKNYVKRVRNAQEIYKKLYQYT